MAVHPFARAVHRLETTESLRVYTPRPGRLTQVILARPANGMTLSDNHHGPATLGGADEEDSQ